MRIYPDTSFLVSWIYRPDVHNAKAWVWFSRHKKEEWILSNWSRFETVNTLRNLCIRTGGPKPEAVEASRRYFRHLLQHGPFSEERVDWPEVIRDCNQISSALAWKIPARSADVLHVAIIEQINPDIFVSADGDQLALAKARGFQTASFI